MRLRNKKAFTLIEIIVVLIILGVLAAIAIPNYFSWVSKTGEAQEALNTSRQLKAQLVACLRSHPGNECACFSMFNAPPSSCLANSFFGYANPQPSAHFRYLVHNYYCTNDLTCAPNGDNQGWWIEAINDQSGLHIHISGDGSDTQSRCWSKRIINYVVVSNNEGVC